MSELMGDVSYRSPSGGKLIYTPEFEEHGERTFILWIIRRLSYVAEEHERYEIDSKVRQACFHCVSNSLYTYRSIQWPMKDDRFIA